MTVCPHCGRKKATRARSSVDAGQLVSQEYIGDNFIVLYLTITTSNYNNKFYVQRTWHIARTRAKEVEPRKEEPRKDAPCVYTSEQ